ncbi:hydroxyacid dehydrogenase [Candidatus Bathyarchaeota archaeon]|jgi:D-3-phosphoglycerate dehydrogenase / 2-oxoglutarate reductase|nr:hydroxyacid dehydrogenase [Candidatus Bathyarchaeota archaeon]MBT4319934.1 hydroxyacid dehydrogenase [Candidatus Bathyarchaeota archaeon]MBT4422804.1 hydroxyacid dehydrogenase [Candidatus Bathyarchaeota archaeon]MBT5642038.1 hydroxyacid dehydrogenase [Candidatus Bathyarchaeota archaeon]MBT6603783.1 hydroxyacid dehydrogenase [Candidatus Bathyarchaeota archaeon]
MSDITVIVTEVINPAGILYLKDRGINVIELPPGSTEETLDGLIADADGLITRGSIAITRELMVSSPRLKVVGVHGIGCDHVDLAAAKELGIVVCNTPDAVTVTVAEMAMATTLALLRNVVSSDKAVRAGQWKRKYRDLIGVELASMKVGIIGMGRIGKATAVRMQAFGANISYWSRTRKPDLEKELEFKWMELDDLLKKSELISLHIPATPETRMIIDEGRIESMRDGVYIVNTARGKVIDEEALIKALQSGKVKAAALDVFEKEPLSTDSLLCSLDNVILTPHLSASNVAGMIRMAVQVAEGVLKTINGGEPDNPVV